jgi:hypothetical protein
MASIELTDKALVIHMHGWDKLLALRSSLTLPLEHVRHAVARPGDAHYDRMKGLRLAGGYWPGSFAAGYFWVTGGLGGETQAALDQLEGARERLAAAGEGGAAALAHVDAALAEVKKTLEAAKLPDAARYLAFYDVHDPEKTIGLDVEHERLRRVVVQLDTEEPEAAVARVLAALRGNAR